MNSPVEMIENSNCTRCPDLVSIRKQIVVARGNFEADTIMIGQNPGVDEDHIGKPFMGRAGKLLDDMIEHAGYVPNADFFFTNVTLCHTHKNEAPSTTHINNCRDNLEALIKPFKKVLTIGKIATIGVTTLLAPARSSTIELEYMKNLITRGSPNVIGIGKNLKYLFTTYHTSYLLRSGVTATSHDNALYKIVLQEIVAAKSFEIDESEPQQEMESLF